MRYKYNVCIFSNILELIERFESQMTTRIPLTLQIMPISFTIIITIFPFTDQNFYTIYFYLKTFLLLRIECNEESLSDFSQELSHYKLQGTLYLEIGRYKNSWKKPRKTKIGYSFNRKKGHLVRSL